MNDRSLEIRAANDGEFDGFVMLLDDLGRWLWDRGIEQWAPGSQARQRDLLADLVRDGCLAVADESGRLAGGCIVTSAPTPEWRGHAGDAAYLHKLGVARFAAGRSLGARIVWWCEDWARDRSRSTVRLDCWDGNARLRQYYRDLGYSELGAVPSYGYRVRLFEKSLADSDALRAD